MAASGVTVVAIGRYVSMAENTLLLLSMIKCRCGQENWIFRTEWTCKNFDSQSFHDQNTVRCHYNAVSKKYHRNIPHSSPVRVRYGVSFVDPASDWYSALVPAISNAICYYIGQRYNGTGMYMAHTLASALTDIFRIYLQMFYWLMKSKIYKNARLNTIVSDIQEKILTYITLLGPVTLYRL